MTLRSRIVLATTAPAVLAVVAMGALVAWRVRADRLHDLDLALQGRAAAIARSVEYDDGWELDPVPEHVTAPLAGFDVRSGGEPVLAWGTLAGRVWEGALPIESRGGPAAVDVRVAQDTGPIERGLRRLLVELALLGLGLSAAAAGAGAWLGRRIVDGDEFQRLQRAWERQAAFTSDASHELRTPLAAVRTQAEVTLRQPRTPEQYREALGTILESAGRMQDLIDGLLVLARAGDRLDGQPVDLVSVLTDAVSHARAAPGVEVTLDAPPTALVRGDPRLLRSLVDNLLSNATRHTRAGTISVRLARDGGWVLTVADSGEGIPPEHVARVFDRFHRVDEGRSRTDGGAGLGLSIVQAIASQHGGTVALESGLGRGTTVTVGLPGLNGS